MSDNRKKKQKNHLWNRQIVTHLPAFYWHSNISHVHKTITNHNNVYQCVKTQSVYLEFCVECDVTLNLCWGFSHCIHVYSFIIGFFLVCIFSICIWTLFLFAVWRPQVRQYYKYERLKNGVNAKIRQTKFSIWFLIFSHAILTCGFIKSIKTENAKWKQMQNVEIFNVQHFLLLVFIALIENVQSAI